MTTSPTFFELQTLGDSNDERNAFADDYVVGLEDEDWKTGFGRTTAAEWPPDAVVKLRSDSGRRLTDVLGNAKNTLMVSPKARAVFERALHGVQVEYLPFALLDHRGRQLAPDYVIVNPIGAIDCLDLGASDVVRDARDAAKVRMVNRAVLARAKVGRTPALFRIAEDPTSYVIHAGLRDALLAAGCSNVVVRELEVR
ncbi:MAG: DUF1629 domain-containing protein [Planctomycetota bacterium]